MKNSRYERTTRSGVPSSPSRLGSSPAQRISVRIASMACSRVGRCTAAGGSGRRSDKETEEARARGINILFLVERCAPGETGSLPGRRSVEANRLVGAIEREGRNANGEAVAAPRFHVIGADHDTRRRRQRGPARIFEAFAGPENRLLADDARTAHLLHLAAVVGDPPIAAAQLDCFSAAVLDADVVGPHVMVFDGRRLVLEVKRLDRHLYRSGGFRVHRRDPRFPAGPAGSAILGPMSVARRMPSRSARGCQQVENSLLDLARALGIYRLDADMAGAGVPMLLDAGADRVFVAPRRHRIEKALRTAAGEVVVTEAFAPPAVDVVFQLQIAGERLSRGAARSGRVGFEQDPDFRAQQ